MGIGQDRNQGQQKQENSIDPLWRIAMETAFCWLLESRWISGCFSMEQLMDSHSIRNSMPIHKAYYIVFHKCLSPISLPYLTCLLCGVP